MRPSPRHARLPLRAVRAAAVLCLLAYAALPLHDALVEHVVCAQHGEVVHAGEGDHPQLAAAHAASEGLGRAAPAPEATHDADAHCALGAARRVVLGAPAATLPVELAAHVAVPAVVARSAAHPLTVLAVAPKASPPRG